MGSRHEKVEHDSTSTSEIPLPAQTGEVEISKYDDVDEMPDRTAPSPMDVLKTIPVTNVLDRKTWLAGAIDRLLRTMVQTIVGYTTVSGLSANGGFNLVGLIMVVLAAIVISAGTSFISFPSVSNSWLYQITERAVKTFVQCFMSGMVSVTVGGASFVSLPSDYTAVLLASGVAAVTSILTSIISTNVGAVGTVDVIVPGQALDQYPEQNHR